MRIIILLLAALPSWTALADQPVHRPIPIQYVSPGASGGVESSSRSQSYDIYGGHAVPSQGYGRNQVEIHGSSSVRHGGSIRQSTEYPGGIEVQRHPGQSDYELQRNR